MAVLKINYFTEGGAEIPLMPRKIQKLLNTKSFDSLFVANFAQFVAYIIVLVVANINVLVEANIIALVVANIIALVEANIIALVVSNIVAMLVTNISFQVMANIILWMLIVRLLKHQRPGCCKLRCRRCNEQK